MKEYNWYIYIEVNVTCIFSRSYHARRKGTPVNMSYCENWNSYSDYHILHDHWSSHPTMAKRWHQDRWFAYQFLNGVNPVLITRCDSLPENFPVTHDLVKASLDRGESLEKEINVRRLYIFFHIKVFIYVA